VRSFTLLRPLSALAVAVNSRFRLPIFNLADDPKHLDACDANAYNISMNGIQVFGLSEASAAAGQSAEACQAAACAAMAQVWQWCPPTGCGANGTPLQCWIGSIGSQTENVTGWVSSARADAPIFPPFPWPAPNNISCPTDFACADFDDSDWRDVTLPHDYVDEGAPCELCGDRNHGYLPFNISYYRKTFTVPVDWMGQPVWLDFDGIYRSSDIWLNNVWVGHWESGYAPGRFYLHNVTGGSLFWGADNVIVVRTDGLTFQEGACARCLLNGCWLGWLLQTLRRPLHQHNNPTLLLALCCRCLCVAGWFYEGVRRAPSTASSRATSDATYLDATPSPHRHPACRLRHLPPHDPQHGA